MTKLKKFVKPVLIATPLVLLLAQCSVGNLLPIAVGKKIWFSIDSSDSTALSNQVRQMIPIGSSITDAKSLLEFNGFECLYRKESDPPEVWDMKRSSKDGDYLFCDHTQSYLVCAITYSTTATYIKNTVTSVDSSTKSYCM